jgi:hypothetical protein
MAVSVVEAADVPGEDGKAKSFLKKMSATTMGLMTAMQRGAVDAELHSLHAFLTFVSAPLSHLVATVLDNPVKPIFPDVSKKTLSSSKPSSSTISAPPTPASQASS